MSEQQNHGDAEDPGSVDAEDRDAPEDAVMVIRAWHEGGTDDPEGWHWRGQISHKTTTQRFVGLGMLFDVIHGMLGKVARGQSVEDRDG